MKEKNIILRKDNYIAEGSHRRIYLHDNYPGKCLKITMIEGQRYLKENTPHFWKKLRPLSWFDESRKEIRAYRILENKKQEIFDFIPRFYGLVKTNLGNAMLVDYIDHSITLKDYIYIWF